MASERPLLTEPRVENRTQIVRIALSRMNNLVVGAAGFEPATFWSQTRRATRLRYAPDAARFRYTVRFCAASEATAHPGRQFTAFTRGRDGSSSKSAEGVGISVR